MENLSGKLDWIFKAVLIASCILVGLLPPSVENTYSFPTVHLDW